MEDSKAIRRHRELAGKIATQVKGSATPEDLPLLYTPGVGEVSRKLAEDPQAARELTLKGNTVAVVSDGSAVLGLGNIGPYGALPVMEGKAMLFKALGGINSFPICLDTQDPEEIIETVKLIAPAFGGINLEDIASPKCYEIERRLQEELEIPVMHDDQHATAIIVLAGLINAAKVINKELTSLKVVVVGAGAAGNAVTHLLHEAGLKEVIICDSKGILSPERDDLDEYKQELVGISNPGHVYGTLSDAAQGADAIIGLSGPGSVTVEMISSMAAKKIVFALANPTPEITPEEARAAGATVIATGRSDFPNQLNNVLVFPGIFKGMLESGVRNVTPEIKLRTARAIASLVPIPTEEEIIPSVFDERVARTVAEKVAA